MPTRYQPAGTWSDDTSMTLCMMDSLTERGIDYTDQMRRFSDWLWSGKNTARGEVFDVGGATKSAIFKFVKGTPALQCGETAENTCGNGSLMRILPVALFLVWQYKNRELDDRAAEIIHNVSKCTHAHLRCQMACGIYCSIVFQLSTGTELSEAVREGICSALAYYRGRSEFTGVYQDFASLGAVKEWSEEQISSTGYVLHTLQASLWCLLTTSSYAECVVKAANLGRDTDTTAAVAGGLAVIWYGAEEIPSKWAEQTAQCEEIKARCRRFFKACASPSAQ